MYKFFLFSCLIFIGGCVSESSPDNSYYEEEQLEENNEIIYEDNDGEETTMQEDADFAEQLEAEHAIEFYGKIKEKSVNKNKPISYERSIIRDATYKKKFIETWKQLNQEEEKSIDFSNGKLEFASGVYSELFEASKNCCLSGISSELERQSIEKNKNFEFLKNDYNFYRAGELCYFYSKKDIETIFGRSNDVRELIEKVQKNCLCLNKKRLKEKTTILYSLLNHKAVNRRSLIFKGYDEFGRQTNRYIISDIKNIDKKLRCCIQK